MKTTKGRVVKAVASKFWVDADGSVKMCFARKKLKSDGAIYVGDSVGIARDRDAYVIETVYPRSNALVRPYVANVDVCLIVLAPEPAPDFLLADKVIVNCLAEGITPVLVWNKCDLEKAELAEYNNVCESVVCSAETGEGIDALAALIQGKTACFAGQSAVGKSSVINALLASPVMQVGELAKKIKRGRHTTRARRYCLSAAGPIWWTPAVSLCWTPWICRPKSSGSITTIWSASARSAASTPAYTSTSRTAP